ncbi:MurR/RpiR family transcriptional regulator [Lacimicrobium alkaliphilum]|uniref:Fe-S cluster assembly protein HesB n=1 Tax=Lacimicrobium alkaliphilum TaxID=1526571 RepID=A0A0U3AX49_9ALTE|nr:MurR/RpiR family transcriptional regulator [Lacimicrobium alkaliphilum]ALS97576.1 Fe-S cluster assembly protein HesB [Lacimicrobium alkaliphilum]
MSIKAAKDLEQLNAAITRQFGDLSKRLQQVAKYVLEKPNGIAFGTVVMVANEAKVHPSTLIRFANAFGFSGFSDMQKLFQHKLLKESSNYEDRIKLLQDDHSLDTDFVGLQVLKQFSQANGKALEYLTQNINASELEKAREILKSADTVHVKAVRRSFPIASYLAYLLNHINLRCYLHDGVGGLHKEQEHLIRSNDAIIVISFHPYASETQSAAEAAVASGVPLILFTDSPLSPLKELATVCFTVKEAEVHSFRSLTSTMCLVQSLAISLAH